MELYVMQHSEALSEDVDPERSLSPLGKRQAQDAGKALRTLGVAFSHIICSPKKRARETALAVAKGTSFPEEEILTTKALEPLVKPEEMISELMRMSLKGPVLLAGHLPSLADLVAHLMDSKGKVLFRMGGVGCLHIKAWEKGCADLIWYLAPEHLALLAAHTK